MKYGVVQKSPNHKIFTEINQVEYCSYKVAWENLFSLLYLEEDLDLVVENYFEYEIEQLSIATKNSIRDNLSYQTTSLETNLVIRRIANLLTTCTMYLDQSEHLLSLIYGIDSFQIGFLKELKQSNYDNNLGYRVMEGIRNHVQHRGFPIHGLSYPMEWVDFPSIGKTHLQNSVVPFISISSLEKDLKFNKSILKELKSVVKNNTDNIDIRQFISIYISCIGNIQKRIREIIHYDSQKWEQILTNLINKYQNSMVENEPVSSVFVISVDENDQKVEEYPIFQEFMEVRKMLELKNNIFANLEKRFISNIIKDNDP